MAWITQFGTSSLHISHVREKDDFQFKTSCHFPRGTIDKEVLNQVPLSAVTYRASNGLVYIDYSMLWIECTISRIPWLLKNIWSEFTNACASERPGCRKLKVCVPGIVSFTFRYVNLTHQSQTLYVMEFPILTFTICPRVFFSSEHMTCLRMCLWSTGATGGGRHVTGSCTNWM